MSANIKTLVNQPYKYGFVTDIETEQIPRGLSEDVIPFNLSKEKRARIYAGFFASKPIVSGLR